MKYNKVFLFLVFGLAFSNKGVAQFECIRLSSAVGTDNQIVCIGSPITPISYALGSGVTSANVTGLPPNVFALVSSGSLYISGTPSGTGTFNYEVTVVGTCFGDKNAKGTITVSPPASASIFYPGSPFCNNLTAPQAVTLTGTSGGTFSASPSGLNISVATGSILPYQSVPGTYTVTYNVSGCGTATATTPVRITARPVATFSYPESPYCSNDSDPMPVFSGGGVAGSFSSTSGLVFVNTSTGQVDLSASTPGTYTVTNTIAAAGGCDEVTATAIIRINSLPVATFSYMETPYCSNEPDPFPTFIGGGVAGTFSSTEGLVFVSSSTGQVDLSASVPGAYVVTNTIVGSDGCGTVTSTAFISILDSPALIITNPPAACSPETIDLTSPSIIAGSTPNLIFTYWLDAAATNQYPTPQTAGSGIYYIKGTLATGCFDIKPVQVIINPSPVAVASNDGPVCEGSFLRLTGGPEGMKSYSWTGPNGFVSSQMSPIISASATPDMAGIYILTITNDSDCTDTAQTRVYVYDAPVANAGTGGTECDMDFILDAQPSVGIGLWTMVSGPGTAVFNPAPEAPNARVTVSAYGTYTFRWTETNGPCSDDASVTVNFYQSPLADAGTGGTECDMDFILNAQPSVGKGLWTMVSGPGTAAFDPSPEAPNARVTVSAYGTYTFRWTETNGPCSDDASVTVNFYQMPEANAGTGGNNCGLDFNFRAVTSVGTGTWTLLSGPGTVTFIPGAGEFATRARVSVYGTYVFRWTEVNGTCSSSDDVTVTFIQQPSANAGSGGDECDLDFKLNAVQGPATGTWSLVSGPGTASFSPNANQADATVTVSIPGSYDFAWTEVNSQCTSSDIVRVTFHDKPELNAGDDVLLCKGGNVQLNATGQGSFAWAPTTSLSNPDIRNPIASPQTTTEYTVTLTDKFQCVNTDNVIVEVREQPVAYAGPDQVLDFVFETRMNAGTLKQNETGIWSVIESEGRILNPNAPKSRVTDLSIEDNVFLWTVSNEICPESSDTVHIWVNNLIIPSLITPNRDGNNDFFVIKGLETIGKASLTIFNRWGGRVYENDEYDNSWEGVDDKENPLPDDTYFYVLKPVNGKAIKGYLVIRR